MDDDSALYDDIEHGENNHSAAQILDKAGATDTNGSSSLAADDTDDTHTESGRTRAPTRCHHLQLHHLLVFLLLCQQLVDGFPPTTPTGSMTATSTSSASVHSTPPAQPTSSPCSSPRSPPPSTATSPPRVDARATTSPLSHCARTGMRC